MKAGFKSIGFPLVTSVLLVASIACNKRDEAASFANGNPDNGNLAPVSEPVAPPQTYTPPAQSYAPPPAGYNESNYDQNYYAETGSVPYEQVVEAPEPPPPLPEYSQPPCPGEDYMWTPGYWAYSTAGYYWVPGAWVLAPWVGALWTPPWWGYNNGAYLWHAGFWAPHIGFYGGIDYGYGYTGRGYYGAYWNNGHVDYNRAVNNINTAVAVNIYDARVPAHRRDWISYNGGRGGIDARPTAPELAVARYPRTPPVTAQVQHAREASGNREQFATAGRVRPATLAGGPLSTQYHAPAARPPEAAMRAVTRPAPAPRGGPASERAGAPPARPAIPENRTASQEFRGAQPRPLPESRPSVAERRAAAPQFQQPQGQVTPQGRPGVAGRIEEAPRQFAQPPMARPENRGPGAEARGRAPQFQMPNAPAGAAARQPVPERGNAFQRNAPQALNGPAPAARPYVPERRGGPPTAQATPQARPAPAFERTAPQARPAPQPVPPARPQPQARPAPQPVPQGRPQPQARPEPQPVPQARPQPQARPAPQPVPQARPQPQARPAPQPFPQARPQPQARPAPQPAPPPQARPAPEAHPGPQSHGGPGAAPGREEEHRGH